MCVAGKLFVMVRRRQRRAQLPIRLELRSPRGLHSLLGGLELRDRGGRLVAYALLHEPHAVALLCAQPRHLRH